KITLSPDFSRIWHAYYTYYNYFFILQYPQMHQAVKLNRFTDTIPEENYTVLKSVPDAFDDNFIDVPPYLLYLTSVLEIKLKSTGYCYPANDSVKIRMLQDSLITLGYQRMTGRSSEYNIAQGLYMRIKNQSIERTHNQLDKFKKKWPNSEYL